MNSGCMTRRPQMMTGERYENMPFTLLSRCCHTMAKRAVLQSPVVSVGFARFHPNLLVGGTYSGQIVLWDNRSHRRTPVQRTPLSAAAHTHPVYCVNVVGTQNANNLITVSTDGRMCSWSLDMLSQPQESMELVYNKSKPVAVTGMAFPTGDVNNYIVGSEEGTVYTASRHGSKAGICEMFEGHQGPVTGISCHSAVGPVDFSHLFVTSSFDWTVKLWSTKQNKPLYSFEDNADYVYDVMWSPVHPSLFAAVDGMGRLDLWNLNNDTEVPTASVTIEGAPALNRVRWAAGGKEVAVGDSEGRVWIYDVGESPHDLTTVTERQTTRTPMFTMFFSVSGFRLVCGAVLILAQCVVVIGEYVGRACGLFGLMIMHSTWPPSAEAVTNFQSRREVPLLTAAELAVPHSEDWARFGRTLMEIRANHGDGEEEGPVELAT
ncbi:Cytoplasmic dynein 1 intermediate chain 1 [Labeo rohita]|uniref:Cytoplasmic dynein 1 intermediate chain 1 n=1 Tax=Labeo rohita TaxID=84645 RepID=A0ABQ8LQB5_LABRO|nr:Cytoplasmic dynein 1 intermediate chain 1 [Labeo rohita]